MGCTTSAEPEDHSPVNADFVDLSHFVFLKQVGKGGFADVFVARRKSLTKSAKGSGMSEKKIEQQSIATDNVRSSIAEALIPSCRPHAQGS
jgi:hypothetical protein